MHISKKIKFGPSLVLILNSFLSFLLISSVFPLELVPFISMFSLFSQLNPDVNAFQRKFVNEVRRCEEMDRKLSKWAEIYLPYMRIVSVLAPQVNGQPGPGQTLLHYHSTDSLVWTHVQANT